jgi:hypothetical protein
MTYTTAPLPEPARVKMPGKTAQELAWAVLRDGRIYALFEKETSATALAKRLNGWLREHGI